MVDTRKIASDMEALANRTRHTVTEAENKYREAVYNRDWARKTGANAVEMARVNMAYEEAAAQRNRARTTLQDEVSREIDAIRSEMIGAFAGERSLDPESVDHNTMELLKLPDISPAELKSLAEKAQSAGNHTMLRIISADARRRRDAMGATGDRETILQLTEISEMKTKTTEAEAAVLDTFEAVTKIIKTGILSPDMFALSENILVELLAKMR